MTGTARVRALKRGLDVLREVSRSHGVRPADIAQKLGLARGTAYRIIETLEELGYVVRSATDGRFHVTQYARSLGEGFDIHASVSQAAGPELINLGARFLWPVHLATYDGCAMVIQESTQPRSPFSIARQLVGRRLPMLRTAAGHAYLAFCPDAERESILAQLRRIDDPQDRNLLRPRQLQKFLDETRQQGFGARSGERFLSKTTTLAVPINAGPTVIGCIIVVWITSALKLVDAVAQFAKPMQKAAADIAANHARQWSANGGDPAQRIRPQARVAAR